MPIAAAQTPHEHFGVRANMLQSRSLAQDVRALKMAKSGIWISVSLRRLRGHEFDIDTSTDTVAKGVAIACVNPTQKQAPAKIEGGDRINACTEHRPPAWRARIGCNLSMRNIEPGMAQQCRCDDPETGPETNQRQENENCGKSDLGDEYAQIAAQHGEQVIIGSDHDHHHRIKSPVTFKSRNCSKAARAKPKDDANNKFHDRSLSAQGGI